MHPISSKNPARRRGVFCRSVVPLICTIAFLVVALRAPVARANQDYPWAIRHYSGSGLFYIHYDNQCSPSDYEAAVDQATNGWTATQTPLVFRKVSSNCQPYDSDVDTFTGWFSDVGTVAITWNYTTYCTWNAGVNVCGYGDIYLPGQSIDKSVIRMNTNQNSFGNLGAFGMVNAMTHEFGHTLGLAHVPCSEALSIMNTGGCNSNINTPTQKDVNDINSMYCCWP